MILRRGNHSKQHKYNPENNTIIDGYTSAEQLYKNMVEAGKINIASMYPKNTELEQREIEIIENEQNKIIKEAIKNVGKNRAEKIDEIYEAKARDDRITQIKNRIAQLEKEIAQTNDKKYIEALQDLIKDLQNEKAKS